MRTNLLFIIWLVPLVGGDDHRLAHKPGECWRSPCGGGCSRHMYWRSVQPLHVLLPCAGASQGAYLCRSRLCGRIAGIVAAGQLASVLSGTSSIQGNPGGRAEAPHLGDPQGRWFGWHLLGWEGPGDQDPQPLTQCVVERGAAVLSRISAYCPLVASTPDFTRWNSWCHAIDVSSIYSTAVPAKYLYQAV
jgi:hypothetical protein